MPISIRIPKCVEVLKDIWDSEPFDREFIKHTYGGNKFYFLEESDCKSTLLNLLNLIDNYGGLERCSSAQYIMEFISTVSCLLAVNIRSNFETEFAPLLDCRKDSSMKGLYESPKDDILGFEVPISNRRQISQELHNAFASIKNFSQVAPAIGWAVIGYFRSGMNWSVFENIIALEIQRWKQCGSSHPIPRGCIKFLQQRLPLVSTIVQQDIRSLDKYVAGFMQFCENRSSSNSELSNDVQILSRYIHKYNESVIQSNLSTFVALEDITNGNISLSLPLMHLMQNNASPEFEPALINLHRFVQTIAVPEKFTSYRHGVYSALESDQLSFLREDFDSSTKRLVQILKDIDGCLKKNKVSEVTYVNDVVEEFRKSINIPEEMTPEMKEWSIRKQMSAGQVAEIDSKRRKRRNRGKKR